MLPTKEPFGRWLLRQSGDDSVIGEIGKAAAQDPGFPRAASFEVVRDYLAAAGADDDALTALEDARLEWLPDDPVSCDVILTAAQKDAVLDGPLRGWLLEHCQGSVAGHLLGGFYTLRFEREDDAAAFRAACAEV